MEQADPAVSVVTLSEDIPVAEIHVDETTKAEQTLASAQSTGQQSAVAVTVADSEAVTLAVASEAVALVAEEDEKAEDPKENEAPTHATVVKGIAKAEEVGETPCKQEDAPGEQPADSPAIEQPVVAVTVAAPKSSIKRRLTPNIPLSTSAHFGPEPAIVTCQHCQSPTVTMCEPVCGTAFIVGMVVSAVLVPVFGIGCIPGCVLLACKPAHDILHKCPKCLNELGRFKRL